MRISIIGSRGIPAAYGGFETQAEHLAVGFASRGHSVTVGCEGSGALRHTRFQGVELIHFPLTPPRSYKLRMAYEFMNDLFFLTMMARNCDVIYCLGCSAGCVMFLPHLLNRSVDLVVNIDGVEWNRGKFSRWIRAALKVNTGLAMIFADRIAIDSRSMSKHILKKCRTKTVFLPNGVETAQGTGITEDVNLLRTLLPNGPSLSPGGYWLLLARLEPENNISMIIEGYLRSNSRKPLVIVGSFSSDKYKGEILELVGRNEAVAFVGSHYEQNLVNLLRKQAFGYIHGHSVGGTNPSLLEAMVSGSLIL